MLSLGRWPSVSGCKSLGQFASVSLVHLSWLPGPSPCLSERTVDRDLSVVVGGLRGVCIEG